jgi:tRNA(fMet)-specific endonuclease VapC
MYILDTDHLSILERGTGPEAQKLLGRLAGVGSELVATTIITYEEQTRGWMAYLAQCRTVAEQVAAYARLEKHLANFRIVPVVGFDEGAAVRYQQLRSSRLRVGTMDLKIGAIALSRQATLLTRNVADFKVVPNLKTEDWTA